MKNVIAFKAIYFNCEECEHGQYADYNLEEYLLEDSEGARTVLSDVIDCEKCGKPSRVIEEI
jgi:hypothetical protein